LGPSFDEFPQRGCPRAARRSPFPYGDFDNPALPTTTAVELQQAKNSELADHVLKAAFPKRAMLKAQYYLGGGMDVRARARAVCDRSSRTAGPAGIRLPPEQAGTVHSNASGLFFFYERRFWQLRRTTACRPSGTQVREPRGARSFPPSGVQCIGMDGMARDFQGGPRRCLFSMAGPIKASCLALMNLGLPLIPMASRLAPLTIARAQWISSAKAAAKDNADAQYDIVPGPTKRPRRSERSFSRRRCTARLPWARAHTSPCRGLDRLSNTSS